MNQDHQTADDAGVRRRAVNRGAVFCAGLTRSLWGSARHATPLARSCVDYFDVAMGCGRRLSLQWAAFSGGWIPPSDFSCTPSFARCGQHLREQAFGGLCHRAGFALWLDPLRRPRPAAISVPAAGAETAVTGGVCFCLPMASDTAPFDAGSGLVHWPVYALDGALSAAISGTVRESDGYADRVWSCCRYKFDHYIGAVDA